ncbi:MAG: DUF1080 domain-containing protein [Opitutales bacterium]
MKKLLAIFLGSIISLSAFATKDEFVGFYKGDIEGFTKLPYAITKTVYAEVYRLGDNYRLRIQPKIMARADTYYLKENLKAKDGKISFEGHSLDFKLSGSITPEELKATGTQGKTKVSMSLKRYSPHIEAMGAKAPKDAIVIFDGKDMSKLEHAGNIPSLWTLEDGAMIAKTDAKNSAGKPMRTSIYTKEAFDGAFKLHVEFRIPTEEYHLLGQKRNNSGVFMGDYEVQILDSFGLESQFNDCGSIYRQSPPYVNACLEPGAWQCYDITFYPPEFDENGKPIKDPVISVYQNGVKVQSDTIVPTTTTGGTERAAKYTHVQGARKLMFQEHTNKIAFRNIWLLPIEK